jgi:MGT family glycosyltransferase
MAMLSRGLVISPFPPSLRDPACPPPATLFPVRPTGARPHSRGGGQGVYATLGTVFNVESGDLLSRVAQGLARLDMPVTLTVGPQIDPAELGRQPPQVRVERFVDQWTLLPRCRLVVSHAGSGTVVGALAHGLPMVLLPMGADQPLNAARCEALGVARVLDPVSASPDDIEGAARGVLNAPDMRTAAGAIASEINGLPDITHALTQLERLAP